MPPWTLLDYQTPGGDVPYRDWYANQDVRVQAAFDAIMFTQRAVPNWLLPKRPVFSPLTKKHPGLYEFRFSPLGKRLKFRVIGLYRPEEMTFVFLGGCVKELSVTTPKDAFDVAMQHKLDFDSGLGATCEHF